jgi:hypothetical protein
MNRRSLLRLAGAATVGTLAGCTGGGTETGPDSEQSGPDTTPENGISTQQTIPLGLRGEQPGWVEDATGRVVVIDSETRLQAALQPYGGRDGLSTFLDGVDFDTERVVLVETIVPNRCYERLEISNVRLEDDRLRAEAEAVETSDGNSVCAQALAYPSTLLRVGFADDPVDEAAIRVTDGQGDTATVAAGADDALSPDPADLAGSVQPDGSAEPIAPLSCDEESFQRHGQWYEESAVRLGELQQNGGAILAMRADSPVYERGDTVRVTMRNVAEQTVETGNEHKYNLQAYTEDGWQDVRGGDGPFAYTDIAVGHAPGEGFEWSFEFTESGVAESEPHEFEVCPGLPSGRYRFAYFGVIGDGALAVEFDFFG